MKNILKSIFVSSFIMYAVFSVIQSILHLVNHGFSYRYIGRLLASFTVSFLFIKAMALHNTARTSPNLWFRTALITIGFLISLIGGGIYENNEFIGSSPSLILLLGWLAYVFWYSRFDKRIQSFEVGSFLPDFELEDISKNKVSSRSFLGNSTIMMFYRGNWCPLCMAQIKEISSQYKDLEKRGVTMVLISPQPHHFSKSLAKKYNVNFQFLVDVDNKVAKQLEIFHKNGLPLGMQMFGYKNDTVMPTILITDAKGKIIFTDLTDNYRVRPEPETFFRILDGIH
jgi:peroxiredoxin